MACSCRRESCSAARRSVQWLCACTWREWTCWQGLYPLITAVQPQALEVLLHDAEAQLGAPAVEALRQDFVTIKQELAQSCKLEQDALDECAALEQRRERERLAAAAAPPEPDDANSIIADCRWAARAYAGAGSAACGSGPQSPCKVTANPAKGTMHH